MNEINPLANVILGSVHQQRVLGIERNRQLRRAKVLAKNVESEDEHMESEVETADKLAAVHDQTEQREQSARQDSQADDSTDEIPHIDIRG